MLHDSLPCCTTLFDVAQLSLMSHNSLPCRTTLFHVTQLSSMSHYSIWCHTWLSSMLHDVTQLSSLLYNSHQCYTILFDVTQLPLMSHDFLQWNMTNMMSKELVGVNLTILSLGSMSSPTFGILAFCLFLYLILFWPISYKTCLTAYICWHWIKFFHLNSLSFGSSIDGS